MKFENDAEYFAFQALSASQIKTFNTQGKYAFWKTSPLNPEKKAEIENDAMIFGSYCHCLLLEPEEVAKRYLVLDWGTKTRFTAKWKKAVEENPNVVLISPEEQEKAEKMVSALKNHRIAKEYLKDLECESSVVWKDEATELMCKAKIDGFRKDANGKYTIVDYKTSSDIDGVLKRGENFQYPLQAEFYKRALRAEFGNDIEVDFIFIIQSSKEDESDKIAVAYVENETSKIAEQIVDNTMAEIKELLDEYKVFQEPTVFEQYPDLQEISYSRWYLAGNL